MPFLPAGVGAAVAGGVASGAVGLVGSALSKGAAAGGASDAQAVLAQQRADLSPFRTAGGSAVGVASDLAGANGPDAATAAMANFHTDPGYQFQLDQGLRAVDAGAASKGILRSGATIKAEDTFGTGLADQSFTNYYNRLFGLSQLGEQAAAAGSQTAGTAGTLAQGAGNTQAGILGNTASGLGSTIGSVLANPNVQSGINSLFNPSAVSTSQANSAANFQAGAFSQQPAGTFGPFN
jgi:hypothetical protein